VFPGFAAAVVVVAVVDVVVASGELRLGGTSERGAVAVQLSTGNQCNPQISKSLPLRLCLRCCSRGCSRKRGDGGGGGARCYRARGPRRRG
jgi:hypothetical protein